MDTANSDIHTHIKCEWILVGAPNTQNKFEQKKHILAKNLVYGIADNNL